MKTDTSKSTMLVISTGFLAMHLIFHWPWAAGVALAAGIVGIVSASLSRKIEWVWMKIGGVLGYIVPNLLLSLVYFLFLCPLSLLSRLFGRDPLMLSGKYRSYFIDVHREVDKDSF